MKNINKQPLYQRLGIKEGFEVKLINGIASQIHFQNKLKKPVDVIHLFTKSKNELLIKLPFLRNLIKSGVMFWISWPKKNSNYASDLNENVIRKKGLMNGLIDTKVCSIDDNSSALKFVYRTKDVK